jgi:hypothetical protein
VTAAGGLNQDSRQGDSCSDGSSRSCRSGRLRPISRWRRLM